MQRTPLFAFCLIGCKKDWIYMDGNCYTMQTRYVFSNESDNVTTDAIAYSKAANICQDMDAEIPHFHSQINNALLQKLLVFLDIWNHTHHIGDILIESNSSHCAYIKVSFFNLSYFVFNF